ncbi:MAG: CCA tRNA nucleotidyltransferase [Thaumarchaeota archaeon]|nr:CCA tRNA nucleotidyltransferase [Nitrososphaerota archaeon]
MTKLQSVILKARKLVVPSPEEEARLDQVAEKVIRKVEAAASLFREVTGVILGGSFAKGTWLPAGTDTNADIDVFVKIAREVDGATFESIGLKIGREASRGYRHGKKYAQHPYTEATVDGVKVNIVPCYDVGPGEWKSAADRSPYHVEFVKRNLDEEKRVQVRLLKRFMKTVGVYGAEIENEGFSGYAAEVLVHNNGGMEGVLRFFADLKPVGETLLSLRDPIDDDRELARAISKETIARMMLASRSFLDGPELTYFTGIKRRARRALAERIYVLRFDHRRLSEDTLWGELKKSTKQLVRYVEERGFEIIRASAASNDSDRSAIMLLPGTEHLPVLEERVGPGIEMRAEVKKFLSKNRGRSELVWAGDDGRVHILQRREHTELGELLAEVCRSEIEGVGASRELAIAIRRNGRIVSGRGVREEASKERWLDQGVEAFISDTIGTD